MRRPSWLRLPAPAALTAEPLNVAPALVGRPLGSPLRRAAAMATDLALVALLATAGGYWLALVLVLLAWQLRTALVDDGARGQAAARVNGGARRAAAALMVAAVLGAAAYAAWDEWRRDAGGRSGPAAREQPPPPRPSRTGRESAAAGVTAEASRIAELQAELDRLRSRLDQRSSWRGTLDAWLDGVGLSFGWAIVYFSLLPAWAQGLTVGKRLFGLRIVELTGRPVTPLVAFKRYGGYVAGVATGGVGFVQLLWEPNRQALHDKAAHTAVVRG